MDQIRNDGQRICSLISETKRALEEHLYFLLLHTPVPMRPHFRDMEPHIVRQENLTTNALVPKATDFHKDPIDYMHSGN